MADAVTSQTLIDGGKQVVMKFTNVSDGTGECCNQGRCFCVKHQRGWGHLYGCCY